MINCVDLNQISFKHNLSRHNASVTAEVTKQQPTHSNKEAFETFTQLKPQCQHLIIMLPKSR